ncbi:ParB/RepB/Spo0J family partition protein [Kocuria nitroreducens]|uniref:ParB/RepB/Spo0J family partition protein n=1 Tax=Kocuria nitroreducens TaxID=3058914 RepID=UPI0036DBB9B2
MKARMDMGEALRNTTLVSRPSDMFFLPSTTAPEGGESSSLDDRPASTTTVAAQEEETVSRETPSSAPGKTSAEDGAAAKDQRPNSTPGRHRTPVDAPPEAAATPDGDVSRETNPAVQELAAVPGATFADIPVASIHPNRKQPRQIFDEEELAELAYSIGELGVLQPIVVRPTRENGDEAFELVMGERRWRASQQAGLPTVPAIVRETADDDLLRDALLENLHRSQLNPLEEAAAYQQLLEEFGATQEELSRRIGRSRPQISNTIRLLRLPPLVQRRVAAGVLSSGHARALLSLADPAEMERLAQRIVAEGLSVRATEEAVQLTEAGPRTPQRSTAPAGRNKERLDYIAEAFSDRLDTSVRIALGARKGRMTIEFATVEDLNRIIEVLDPGMDRT